MTRRALGGDLGRVVSFDNPRDGTKMQTFKPRKRRIYGRTVVESNSSIQSGRRLTTLWNVMEQRAGELTGRVTYTGTMREVRAILKNA